MVQTKITKPCSLENIRIDNSKQAANQELQRETLDEPRKHTAAAPRIAPKPRGHSATAAVPPLPTAGVTSTTVLVSLSSLYL